MKFTKKSSYLMLLVSALIGVLQSILFILAIQLPILQDVSLALFGAGVLFLAAGANGDKKLLFTSLLSVLLLLIGINPSMYIIGLFAWPALALYDITDNNSLLPKAVIFASVVITAASFFALGSIIAAILSFLCTAVQAAYAFYKLRLEYKA